ncbi:MAG TPA: hypothetical protein RMH99_05095 [Sandaracinaceae bacterium LLY-WYZ-13_1]|nr:hypothetical protein [Sandaracinaceae bacterium LLY-WYZ-13_1]
MSGARRFEVACTVRVTQTPEELSAHVELDAPVEIGPGDRVRVHGGELRVPFGQSRVERRLATVTRASWIERAWVRLTGTFESLELLDVSFTDRRTL